MANDQFQKLLRFARRTGDRLIVTDERGGEPLVILPFEQYEALVNGFLGPDDGPYDNDPEQLEVEHDHAGHSHPHGHQAEAAARVESEFEPEGEEEIGEIEIDPVFLAAPTEAVLEIVEPAPSSRYEPEPRLEPRAVPRSESRTEPYPPVNPPVPASPRPVEAPRQRLDQVKNNGGEEQFYLEPL